MKSRVLSLLSFFAACLVMASCSNRADHFELSIQETVEAFLMSDNVVMPEEILNKVQNEGASLILVDVRSPAEFANGHLQNAINVPTQHILDAEYEDIWKDDATTYYLYGNTQLEANAPWMILKQLGYSNIRVLQGGLTYFADFSDSSWLKLEDETARFDYADIFSKAIQDAEQSIAPASKPAVQERQKVIVPQNRPKLEQPAVQEEEGC
ncbi:MAG: hypothetical protein IPL49_20775 [Saprospirales bacterium]|nr:hypothetical protein [Saprospirales bacterium]MBK8493247.1 hypothetical protein [Saprospirales bacterium]